MLRSFACSRLGSWPSVSQDFSLLSVPQPHSLSLSSDANEEIVVPCALNPGRSDTLVSFFQETIAFTDVLVV